MRRLILCLMACMLLVPAQAAKKNAYTRKMEQLITQDATPIVDRLKQSISQSILSSDLPENRRDSLMLFMDYLNGPFQQEVAMPMYEPLIRKHLKEKDLDWLIRYSEADSTKLLNECGIQMATRLLSGNDEEYRDFVHRMVATTMEIAENGKCDTPFVYQSQQSAEWQATFEEYYRSIDADDKFRRVYNQIKEMMGDRINMVSARRGSEEYELSMAYIESMCKPTMMLLMERDYSIELMRYAIRAMRSPSYGKWKDVQTDLLSHVSEITARMEASWQKYYEAHKKQ